jgi:tRNA(Ile)-lysidine synthase
LDHLAQDLISPAFDRRLDQSPGRPLAVAYSGGGDSLAALVAALAWGQRHGRRVVALHVDHRLQAKSGDWARLAEATALRLGADFVGLAWSGDKPAHGLPAAARRARHALLAEAARAAGASVIVLGHTADDILEADLMRAEGSSLGWLREWGPSPAWPEGRDLFLLRPLLDLRRAAIRSRLAPLGLNWIEDPANADPASARARARLRLGEHDAPPQQHDRAADAVSQLALQAELDDGGGLAIDRALVTAARPDAARRFLSAALACVGGGEAPPRRERLANLIERLAGEAPWVATLAGVRLEAGQDLRLSRETGAYRRHGPPRLRLVPGGTGVWDGRFEVESHAPGPIEILPLAGQSARLCKDQRDSLRAWPAAARGGLPAVLGGDGVTCPLLGRSAPATARSLVKTRLWGACGVISQEFRSELAGAAFSRVAE